jgi:hypothetical protein
MLAALVAIGRAETLKPSELPNRRLEDHPKRRQRPLVDDRFRPTISSARLAARRQAIAPQLGPVEISQITADSDCLGQRSARRGSPSSRLSALSRDPGRGQRQLTLRVGSFFDPKGRSSFGGGALKLSTSPNSGMSGKSDRWPRPFLRIRQAHPSPPCFQHRHPLQQTQTVESLTPNLNKHPSCMDQAPSDRRSS